MSAGPLQAQTEDQQAGGAVRRIAVLGGGIAGLAAAYRLMKARRAGAAIQEILIEAGPRLGGVIRTERTGGFIIEAGPDSFLTEKPQAAALCRELGLGENLIGSNDAARRTYVLHRGRLVPLPDGMMLMVPTRLGPVFTSPLIPYSSFAAMARDWMTRPTSASSVAHDESVADFVRRHFGSAILQNIAEPLLAGVYGGDSERLSVRAVLPRFWEMERKSGSLIRGALNMRKQMLERRSAPHGQKAPAAPPLFTALRDGLEQMVEKIIGQLDAGSIHTNRFVNFVEGPQEKNGVYRIHCKGEEIFEAEAVVMALPAYEAARLTGPIDSELARALELFDYTSAVTVALAYDGEAMRGLPPGFGFLVPRSERRRMLAATFVHQKFPSRAPAGQGLLRCFMGGAQDAEAAILHDREILAIVRRELQEILGLEADPIFYRVYRWPRAMPQYAVGHAAQMEIIHKRLTAIPGFFLCGNAYSGIGIPDSIRTGTEAAEKAMA